MPIFGRCYEEGSAAYLFQEQRYIAELVLIMKWDRRENLGNLTSCPYFRSRNIDISNLDIPLVNTFPDMVSNFVFDPEETYFAMDTSFYAETILDGTMPIPDEVYMSRQSLASFINRVMAAYFVGDDNSE